MKLNYVPEEARKTGRPSEIEVFAHNTREDLEQASVGVAESRRRCGRKGQPVGYQVYPGRGGKLRAALRRV